VRIRNGHYLYNERCSESPNKSVKLALDQKFDNVQNLLFEGLLASCPKTLFVEVHISISL
jgi:hypothetical protein